MVCWETATRAHAFKVCRLRQKSGGQRGTGVSASHPPRRPLVCAPVCDSALLTARDEFEDNPLVAVQASLAMLLGCRQNQPASRDNFVRPALTQDSVTAVRFQFQGGCRTGRGLTGDFYLRAPIGYGKVSLGPGWESCEKQPGSARQ